MWDILLPVAQTLGRRDLQLLATHQKDTENKIVYILKTAVDAL